MPAPMVPAEPRNGRSVTPAIGCERERRRDLVGAYFHCCAVLVRSRSARRPWARQADVELEPTASDPGSTDADQGICTLARLQQPSAAGAQQVVGRRDVRSVPIVPPKPVRNWRPQEAGRLLRTGRTIDDGLARSIRRFASFRVAGRPLAQLIGR